MTREQEFREDVIRLRAELAVCRAIRTTDQEEMERLRAENERLKANVPNPAVEDALFALDQATFNQYKTENASLRAENERLTKERDALRAALMRLLSTPPNDLDAMDGADNQARIALGIDEQSERKDG